ncbi:POL1 [Acrasis kona]|uniref:POL1 n=1 Tax=Acrasis kona TaxID=1008807 RepID=A0AAW2YVS2_9EUKA
MKTQPLPHIDSKNTDAILEKLNASRLREQKRRAEESAKNQIPKIAATEVPKITMKALPNLSIKVGLCAPSLEMTLSPEFEYDDDRDRAPSPAFVRINRKRVERQNELLIGSTTPFATSWQRVTSREPRQGLEQKINRMLKYEKKMLDPIVWDNLHKKQTQSSSKRTASTPRVHYTPRPR